MTPPGGLLPRYTMPTTPVTTYQLPSTSWIHHPPAAGQYIMPSPVTPVSILYLSTCAHNHSCMFTCAQEGRLSCVFTCAQERETQLYVYLYIGGETHLCVQLCAGGGGRAVCSPLHWMGRQLCVYLCTGGGGRAVCLPVHWRGRLVKRLLVETCLKHTPIIMNPNKARASVILTR